MRCIIAGSRNINDYEVILKAIHESGFEIGTVISGGASGVDDLGILWATKNNKNFMVIPKHGKSAGPIRNREMAKTADALIAVWDGKSRGTANMIQEAKKLNLEVYIHHVNE